MSSTLPNEESHSFDPVKSSYLLETIVANVNNDKLSDSDFRQFIKNSLSVAYSD